MLLFFIPNIYSLIRPLDKDGHVRFTNNLLAKTVMLIETELMYRQSINHPWQTVPEYDQSKTNVDIYSSQDNDWQEVESNGKLVAEYERKGPKNSFFFTAGDSKYYLIEFSSDTKSQYMYGIKTQIYEGRQKDPRIISQTDNQIAELSKHMEQGIEYTKLISDVQKLDSIATYEYKQITKSISNLVLVAILLKLLVFYCMFYYFNKKLRDFYVQKKIVK
ncbi:hypothetical protein BDAP_001235 [Binucleata daphniae]